VSEINRNMGRSVNETNRNRGKSVSETNRDRERVEKTDGTEEE
jgi:hypothetical protein